MKQARVTTSRTVDHWKKQSRKRVMVGKIKWFWNIVLDHRFSDYWTYWYLFRERVILPLTREHSESASSCTRDYTIALTSNIPIARFNILLNMFHFFLNVNIFLEGKVWFTSSVQRWQGSVWKQKLARLCVPTGSKFSLKL